MAGLQRLESVSLLVIKKLDSVKSSSCSFVEVSAPWITLFFYDTFIFSLTLWKALKQWRYGNSRLLQILVRDGMIY